MSETERLWSLALAPVPAWMSETTRALRDEALAGLLLAHARPPHEETPR